ESPGFLERVERLGQRFAAGLAGAPYELRRRGLFMGLKFPAPGAGMVATKMLYDRGVFALYANNDTSVLQLLPPLVIGDDEADHIVRTLRETFG
ncbi:MAG TPA: hypothetical protein PKW35_23455, partial [Nannocystaceae bacterium]|nr:hypothetical protein [Nannocystaceae bacterium]